MEIGSSYGEEQINEVCVCLCECVSVRVQRHGADWRKRRWDCRVSLLLFSSLSLSPPLSFSLSHSPLHLLLSLFWSTETAVDSSHLSGVATTLQASRPTMDVFSALVNTRLKISLPSDI